MPWFWGNGATCFPIFRSKGGDNTLWTNEKKIQSVQCHQTTSKSPNVKYFAYFSSLRLILLRRSCLPYWHRKSCLEKWYFLWMIYVKYTSKYFTKFAVLLFLFLFCNECHGIWTNRFVLNLRWFGLGFIHLQISSTLEEQGALLVV